jgi:hypothetical protein
LLVTGESHKGVTVYYYTDSARIIIINSTSIRNNPDFNNSENHSDNGIFPGIGGTFIISSNIIIIIYKKKP